MGVLNLFGRVTEEVCQARSTYLRFEKHKVSLVLLTEEGISIPSNWSLPLCWNRILQLSSDLLLVQEEPWIPRPDA